MAVRLVQLVLFDRLVLVNHLAVRAYSVRSRPSSTHHELRVLLALLLEDMLLCASLEPAGAGGKRPPGDERGHVGVVLIVRICRGGEFGSIVIARVSLVFAR